MVRTLDVHESGDSFNISILHETEDSRFTQKLIFFLFNCLTLEDIIHEKLNL